MLEMVEGDSHWRYSIDFPVTERPNHKLQIPEEYMHTLLPPGMPPYNLHLKTGGVYMLLRNMSVADGLCNGTRFTLIGIARHLLECKIIHDDRNKPEKIFLLPRITTTPPTHYPFPFHRRQYPIRPCFAMTINKSQGGTFDMEGLDASSPMFGHGQAYVALSRVRDFDKITVLTNNSQTTLQNIVYPQVFDKEYIDNQIRLRTARPIISDRSEPDQQHIPAEFYDDVVDEYMAQNDIDPSYDPNDGVSERLNPNEFMYTNDELVYEEDRIATDMILEEGEQ